MARKRKATNLNITSELANKQIAELVSISRSKKGARAGLPTIEINADIKPELISKLKQSLLMQALGYHVDTTNITSYYDARGEKVTNKLGVSMELSNERKYVPPNLKATTQLLEILDPGFFHDSGAGVPQIIDDWGLCSGNEDEEQPENK